MIVWGARNKSVDLGAQGSRHCPTCERDRPFHLVLQYTARHVWWLFRWVSARQYASVCEVCQRGDRLEARAVEAGLARKPIPFGARWSWAFLAVPLVLAAAVGFVADARADRSTEAYLAAPQAGDQYILNVSKLVKPARTDTMYGLLRVRDVKPDSVEFDAPTYFYGSVSGPKKDMRAGRLDEPGYLADTPVVLSRAEIARLQQEHAIDSVWRFPPKAATPAP